MITVHIIGLGMSPDDLTPKALDIIAAAEVLAGGRRHLEYFSSHPGERIHLGKDLTGAFQAIQEAAASRRVVVLASGDPFFYGLGRRLMEFLGPAHVVVHPNITAVQSACSLLKIPWDDAVVVSLHGRGDGRLLEVLGTAEKIIVYTAGAGTPNEIARLLQRPDSPAYRMCVLENLGAADQRVSWLTPAEAANQSFSPLNMVVLLGRREEIAVAKNSDRIIPHPDALPSRGEGNIKDNIFGQRYSQAHLHLGLPEAALAHEAGLITKTEVRAVVLAKLQLRPGQVLWDVGAGCGSVGLEASLLLPGGRIIAVEQHPERAEQIRSNKSRFGVSNLEVVCGAAPDCFSTLPQPDRVFIGGGGSRLGLILEAVLAGVKPRARVVVTAALLATLETADKFFQARQWETEICQVQVSRSRALGHSAYLQALNPVWIISAWPKEANV